MAEWKESEHPRDNAGRFTDKEGSSSSYREEVNERIKWAKENNVELPLNNDGSLNDIRLQKIYNENTKKISQLERKENEWARINQIQEYTGLTYEDSEKTYRAIQYYTKDGFREIRNGHAPEEERLIEKFIELHPKYDGKIWRGISLSKEKGERYLAELNKKKINGETTDMLSLSSWSSSEDIANDFADNREGDYKFVFELENKSGVGIDHLSEWQGEEEVLQSGKVKYKIKDISIANNRYKVKIEEV